MPIADALVARYIDQVLRPHVVPHFARYQNKTFQQDNARAHTARATRDFLQQNNVNVMNWPDLNPIFILKYNKHKINLFYIV
jgi:hypothetical protein